MTCRLDIPKAPLLLGQLLGSAIDEGSLQGASLQEVCEPIEDTEARRELLAHVLKTVQVICKSTKQEGYIASAHIAFWQFQRWSCRVQGLCICTSSNSSLASTLPVHRHVCSE